ncbi:methyltransferase [Streptomyces sp. NPDC002851]
MTMTSGSTESLLGPDEIAALRDALERHGYTRDGIVARVGRVAAQALNHYEPGPVLRVLGEDDPLAVLIQLFLCGYPVPLAVVEREVVPLLENAGDGFVRSWAHLAPYERWWVVSDFPTFLRGDPADRRPDHVLPVGPADVALQRATLTHPVGSALDLGTGCGVLALPLTERAEHVTVTDLSPRAARFAATTAALNECEWDVRLGDLAQPVAGRRFDLVVSNPPYAVGPGTVHCLYRDSGRPGDAVCAELAGSAADLLTEGGHLQFRANWAHVAGEDWQERVASWLPPGAGLDAWVVEQERTEVRAYVEHWLDQSGGEECAGQRETWLRWFEDQKIEAVGGGTVSVRRTGTEDSVVRVEQLGVNAGALGAGHVADWFARQEWLRGRDLLGERFAVGEGVVLWQRATHRAGQGDAAGWGLQRQLLEVPGGGLNWRDEVSPLAVALVGGAGRGFRLREQIARLSGPAAESGTSRGAQGSGSSGAPPTRLTEAALREVRRLVERGVLVPWDEAP